MSFCVQSHIQFPISDEIAYKTPNFAQCFLRHKLINTLTEIHRLLWSIPRVLIALRIVARHGLILQGHRKGIVIETF